MFQRFSDQARRVIVLTQEQARLHGHNYIGAEHILLAILLACETGSAATTARALAHLGIDPPEARARLDTALGTAELVTTTHIPFTRQAKTVLENSLREAQALNHEHIEPSHLLLALTKVAADEPDTAAGTAIRTLGFTYDDLRKAFRSAAESWVSQPQLFYSKQARRALTHAHREANENDSATVDIGHILLGVLAMDDASVRPALDALGIDPEQLAIEVRNHLPRQD
ncbi:Clp protease N-terminal domain-containing protein [Nocardia sp. NPDC049149]|uniref:Clp protease N-terminal domain-containing protein n=1 Tax=Nocardia sp. NPDC049149 TaxID=3364315 RepID=UPI00371A689D